MKQSCTKNKDQWDFAEKGSSRRTKIVTELGSKQENNFRQKKVQFQNATFVVNLDANKKVCPLKCLKIKNFIFSLTQNILILNRIFLLLLRTL